MVTSTKAVLISTRQQYTKQYCMSIQIRYRSCNVLVPNSGIRYQRYQMLVSVMKTVRFLYRHVYWVKANFHQWFMLWTVWNRPMGPRVIRCTPSISNHLPTLRRLLLIKSTQAMSPTVINVFWCPAWRQAISNHHWRDCELLSPESYCMNPEAWHWY